MRIPWTVHSERVMFRNPWIGLYVAEVERPSGVRHNHHLVRMPAEGAAAVVVNAADQVLLIHRHRFIPGCWGWELPAGRVDPGETPVEAAVREVAEETGWMVRDPQPLCTLCTSPGVSDQRSHVIVSHADHHTGQPADVDEVSEARWFDHDQIEALMRAGEIQDGCSLTGLLWYLHLGSA